MVQLKDARERSGLQRLTGEARSAGSQDAVIRWGFESSSLLLDRGQVRGRKTSEGDKRLRTSCEGIKEERYYHASKNQSYRSIKYRSTEAQKHRSAKA